jgi:hypothetical protein
MMIEQLIQNVMKLTPAERDSFFRMLTENAPVLLKVMPSSALLAYIVSGLHNDGTPLTQAYVAWQQQNAA